MPSDKAPWTAVRVSGLGVDNFDGVGSWRSAKVVPRTSKGSESVRHHGEYCLFVGSSGRKTYQMNLLPRVTEQDREAVTREFDDRGPAACMVEIVEHLKWHNPELLDVASKCAADFRNSTKAMLGFGMFYRLLMPAPAATGVMTPLPCVSAETRALLVREIDEKGSAGFTSDAIAELEKSNPELLQMAHNFASGLDNYLQAMQGFALLYKSLLVQAKAERAKLH
jgi:hypothetical protein